MALAITHPVATKKISPSKLVVGAVVAAMTALVGLAGVAGATSDKPTKQWCNDHGYKNYGQCVKEWAHNKGHGGGYGGYGSQDNQGNQNNGNTDVNADVDTNIDLSVNGDNNVITIIINYIFGGKA
jgi:hypothetical protein